MNPSPQSWDISKNFKYRERYQEHCDDEIYFYDCEFLVDFGQFKKGYICDISIYSQSWGSFTMYVDCQDGGKDVQFVPVWTPVYEAV